MLLEKVIGSALGLFLDLIVEIQMGSKAQSKPKPQVRLGV